MVTISSLWFMIMIELLIATTLVSVLLIAFAIMRKLRDRKVAVSIINKVKEDEARRIAETKKIMLHKFGFDDERAEELAVKIGREERAFYQEVINMYLRRDANALDNLNITFEATVDPYRTLQPPGGGGSASLPANDYKEMKRLKEENKRLSEEIAVTMQTMGRMLSEYSAMFAEKAKEQAANAREEKVVQEEKTENSAKDVGHVGANMIEEMDDLSDLDPQQDKDLKEVAAPENPDELIG